MVFFFNANGELMKSVPARVFQGSNKANTIYVCAPLAETLTTTISFRLSDGTTTAQGLMVLDSENPVQDLMDSTGRRYSVWAYDVPAIVTARAGTVTAQILFTNSDGVVITTDSVSIIVEKGVAPITEIEDINTLNEILEYLSYIMQSALVELNLKNGQEEGTLEQEVFSDTNKNPKATGLGAVALGGVRADKPDEDLGVDDIATIAEGIQAFATGAGTHAKGNWSATFGKDTKAFGRQSIAGGGGTQAGRETDADNTFIAAFAMGELCKALARASAALGNSTLAEGLHSLAIGYGTHTIGSNSFASGEHTETGGNGSATFGSHTGTESNYAVAFGEWTWARALGSLAAGLATIASTPYGAVFGKHNKENQDALLIIGNGNGIDNRNNAFEVFNDGRARVQSAPKNDDDVARKLELNNKLNLPALPSTNKVLNVICYDSRDTTADNARQTYRTVTVDISQAGNGKIPQYFPINLTAYEQTRTPGGTLVTADPQYNYQCVNLQTFNRLKGTKLWKHTITLTNNYALEIISSSDTELTKYADGTAFLVGLKLNEIIAAYYGSTLSMEAVGLMSGLSEDNVEYISCGNIRTFGGSSINITSYLPSSVDFEDDVKTL